MHMYKDCLVLGSAEKLLQLPAHISTAPSYSAFKSSLFLYLKILLVLHVACVVFVLFLYGSSFIYYFFEGEHNLQALASLCTHSAQIKSFSSVQFCLCIHVPQCWLAVVVRRRNLQCQHRLSTDSCLLRKGSAENRNKTAGLTKCKITIHTIH